MMDGVPSRAQQVACGVLAFVLVALGLWTLHGFLSALVWASVFAIAIWPLYRRAVRRWPPGRHNLVLPSLFTAAVALIFITPLTLVAVQFGREAHGILLWMHDVQQKGLPPPDWVTQLPLLGSEATTLWQDSLGTPEASAALFKHFSRGELVDMSRQYGSLVARRVTLFGFTLLTLFFIFRDGESLAEQMLVASRRMFGPSGERVGRQIVASVHGTVDGLVLVGLGEGIVLGVSYAVAGVPHPTVLGALTAVAAMVPFGGPIAATIAAVFLLTQGSTIGALVLLVCGLAVTFSADHFIRPALIGGATHLPFLWVLLGILGGLEVWGFLGLFVGPAAMAALILLWREWTAVES